MPRNESVKKTFPCGDCGKKFHTEYGRQRHRNALHGEQVPLSSVRGPRKKQTEWSCKSCSATFRSENGLQHHQSFAHEVNTWICFDCSPPKSIYSSFELDRHQRDCHLFKCEHCPASFSSKRAIKRHKKEMHAPLQEEQEKPAKPTNTDGTHRKVMEVSIS